MFLLEIQNIHTYPSQQVLTKNDRIHFFLLKMFPNIPLMDIFMLQLQVYFNKSNGFLQPSQIF